MNYITQEINNIYKVIFSIPNKDSKYIKAHINKIILKNEELFQIEYFTKTQAFHENINESLLMDKINSLFAESFRQLQIYNDSFIYGFKLSSKNKLLSNKVSNKENYVVKTHNKKKAYLIEEGMIVPPLIDLNVMNKDGFIVKANYDKYRQINKFLEIIDSTIKDEKKLNIIDFGCGKSYLTFILYYYLTYVKKIDASIIGLDLKEDVIKECNSIKDKYKYDKLSFEIGDISLYKPKDDVDMIISLHACDTATDYAMYHALMLNVKYILCVPCCQHEINKQLKKNDDNILLEYGLIKERVSALLTDSIRANILAYYGYKVNVMEFIDMMHSPKNILIKGIKSEAMDISYKEQIDKMLKEYNITQTLYDLVFKK